MSLPTPKELKRILAEAFFFCVMVLLIVPFVQWGLIGIGALIAILGHWFVGGILMAVGLLGRHIGKNLEF